MPALPSLDPTGLRSHLARQHRGIPWKGTCLAASVANIDLDAPGASIDGVDMGYGERFLAKDQTDATENGIYDWLGAAETARRSYDMDQDQSTAVPADEVRGGVVRIISGTVNGGRIFLADNTSEPQFGVDAITFSELASGSSLIIPVDHGNMGATETLDFAAGDWHRGTLDAACTITVEGFTVDQAGVMVFECTQDGGGGNAIVWDSDVDFGGADDQPDQTADTATVFLLFSSVGDSAIYGAKVGGGDGGTAASTVEDETTLGISPAVGSDTEYARQDHTHGSPSATTIAAAVSTAGYVGPLLISDTHSTPLVFDDILQNDDGDDFLYSDV
jgi:hypothetical protein